MEFAVYTFGSGIFLEKILNAIQFILGDGGFVSVIKAVLVVGGLVAIISKMIYRRSLKDICKSVAITTLVVVVFLSADATVRIHDKLHTSYDSKPVVTVVERVPVAMAAVMAAISNMGNVVFGGLPPAKSPPNQGGVFEMFEALIYGAFLFIVMFALLSWWSQDQDD